MFHRSWQGRGVTSALLLGQVRHRSLKEFSPRIAGSSLLMPSSDLQKDTLVTEGKKKLKEKSPLNVLGQSATKIQGGRKNISTTLPHELGWPSGFSKWEVWHFPWQYGRGDKLNWNSWDDLGYLSAEAASRKTSAFCLFKIKEELTRRNAGIWSYEGSKYASIPEHIYSV